MGVLKKNGISNGEDILWVSNMLGHKDSSMTLEVYARYVKQNNKKRASFLPLPKT